MKTSTPWARAGRYLVCVHIDGVVDGFTKACWRLRSALLGSLLQALSATISRKAWLSGHLVYVEKLCTNARAAFLVIREADADFYLSVCPVEIDGMPINRSRDMTLAPERLNGCRFKVRSGWACFSVIGFLRRLATCQTWAVLTIVAFETGVLRLVTRVGWGGTGSANRRGRDLLL